MRFLRESGRARQAIALEKIAAEYPDFWSDRLAVLAAVRLDGMLLSYASTFRGDREVVWEALTSNPLALLYASSELQDDASIVAHRGRFEFVSERLRADHNFVREFLVRDGCLLLEASAELQLNRELALVATRSPKGSSYFLRSPLHFRSTKEFVLAALASAAELGPTEVQSARALRLAVLQEVATVSPHLLDDSHVRTFAEHRRAYDIDGLEYCRLGSLAPITPFELSDESATFPQCRSLEEMMSLREPSSTDTSTSDNKSLACLEDSNSDPPRRTLEEMLRLRGDTSRWSWRLTLKTT